MIILVFNVLVALWFWIAAQKRNHNQILWAAAGGLSFYAGVFVFRQIAVYLLSSGAISLPIRTFVWVLPITAVVAGIVCSVGAYFWLSARPEDS